jgi:alkylation response protein AidB-like acyl-CoA dehydrogenase
LIDFSRREHAMDLSYSAEYEEFRTKVQEFLQKHWTKEDINSAPPPDARAMMMGAIIRTDERATAFRLKAIERGYLYRHVPKRYGGGEQPPDPLKATIIAEEFRKASAPSELVGQGPSMLAPTLVEHGTEEQKQQFIRDTLLGKITWCQGYSEPGSGSDLASLRTRGVLDGDFWVINGQKIWTSNAHTANWIFVLTRTAPENSKHQGITFLLVPMDQPGVEVRPIKNIAGHSHFNEVFFTDARTAKGNVVGEVNNGWAVANTLLGFERGAGASVASLRFRAELDRLTDLARDHGRLGDPQIRQRLAWAHSKVEIMRYLGMQALTSFLAGEQPGPSSSIGKLNWSEYHKVVTELSMDIQGAAGLVMDGPPAYTGISTADPGIDNSTAVLQSVFLSARAGTIYAGTSQVQRNIIGERILGLPKEPRADTGPWKDIPK